jgi:hypothetical protein
VSAGSANRVTDQYEEDQTYVYISRHFYVGQFKFLADIFVTLIVMAILLCVSRQDGSHEQHIECYTPRRISGSYQ